MKLPYLPGLLIVLAIAITNMALAQSPNINTRVTSRAITAPMESLIPPAMRAKIKTKPAGPAMNAAMMRGGNNNNSRQANMQQRLAKMTPGQYAYLFNYMEERRRNPSGDAREAMINARNKNAHMQPIMLYKPRKKTIDVRTLPSRISQEELRARFATYINKLKH